MKIFLVCDNVDLGYHVVEAHEKEYIATLNCSVRNVQDRRERYKAVKNAYGKEHADKFISTYPERFSVEETELN